MNERNVIERYFSAMRRGSPAETDLIELFAEHAVYVEPFTDDTPAIGIDQIRERLRRGWEQPLPDLELDVVSIEVTGQDATATWVCRSPALPGPMHGIDRYRIENGRITRLEVRLVE